MEAQVGALPGVEDVEHADTGGVRDHVMLRGDQGVVRDRRERALSGSMVGAVLSLA